MSAMLTLMPSFASGLLTPALSARVDFNKYQQGCGKLENFKVQPHGGITRRPGFLLLDELPGEAALVDFVFNLDQTYCLAFGEKWLRVFTADGPVLNSSGAVYHIASPYTLAQAKKMSYGQSADVLFIASEGVEPMTLGRRGHNNWSFTPVNFMPVIDPPSNVAAASTGGSITYVYYVTALNADGKESELSAGYTVGGPPSNHWTEGSSITVTWNAVPDAVEYRVYKSAAGGRPGYVALVNPANNGGFLRWVDLNSAPSLSEGAPKYRNPFDYINDKGERVQDYPRAVSFFEQRLVFASTPLRPQTVWMSKSGDYPNFAVYTPHTADSPWEGTLVNKNMSQLVWMVALRSLVAGATMMEWEISSSQQGAAFSAQTAKATPQSYFGSDQIQALVVGDTILHVARSGAQVRVLKYTFASDSYDGIDESILASNLFEEHRVVSWTYQQHPDAVVWMARSDGALLGMTFQQEHEVVAWHTHTTDGHFCAVRSVPNGHDDVLFSVIKRGVDGHERYFMERMGDPYYGGDYSLKPFLDCALVYDQPGTNIQTLMGLEHLEGKQVGILSKGAVEALRQVVNGQITLDAPSDRVIVGLPYVSEVETMPVDMLLQNTSTVGRKKLLNAVNLRVLNTVGAQVGTSFSDRLETVKWRTTEPYGQAPRPFSGDKRAVVDSMGTNVVTIKVRAPEPTPMTLLAIMAEVKIN